jgi:predicted ATPase
VIGLSGPHRVGKTTLAQAFAQKCEIPFVRTSATEVFAMIGKDPKADYPIEERIAIQEAILYAFERQYAEARSRAEVWISDRTPIDLASFMMADIQRSTFDGSPELAAMVNDYVKRCIDATNLWFSVVVLVQPGIVTVEAEGKAPACPAYMEHLNSLQLGLLLHEKLESRHFLIPRRFTSLEHRVESLKNATVAANESYRLSACRRKASGILLH